MLTIRPESASDFHAVAVVTTEAFGRPNEARLVEALRRSPAFVPELSLVAEDESGVVGHVLFTRISIEGPKGSVSALALAPVSVRSANQRRGIGSALIQRGLEECRRLGHAIIIVLGHSEYYPRFGFVPAGAKGIKAPFEVRPEVFMVAELTLGSLEGVTGVVRYPPEFDAV